MKHKIFIALALLASLITPILANSNDKVFPISTEMQIGRIKNLVDRAPNGIYMTVGGERAFRGASMFEGLEHLIMFDISPDIIRYNNINIQLLKAENKEAYKQLRWEASLSDWQKISKNLTESDFEWWGEYVRNKTNKMYFLPESLNKYGSANKYQKVRQKLMIVYPKVSKKFNNTIKEYLEGVTWSDIEKFLQNGKDHLTKEEFEWFDSERKLPGSCVLEFINKPLYGTDWGQVIDYKSGNYLFDDKLYKRLHKLVLENKITVIKVDLTTQNGVDSLVAKIKSLGFKLAIVDMDNLYTYKYIGEEKLRIALSKLLDLGTKDSILILMSNYLYFPCSAEFQIYVGFTFENVRLWPNDPFFEAFIENLPPEIPPLLDGHLYESKDELPLYLMKQ